MRLQPRSSEKQGLAAVPGSAPYLPSLAYLQWETFEESIGGAENWEKGVLEEIGRHAPIWSTRATKRYQKIPTILC